jgi:hypothetical protein
MEAQELKDFEVLITLFLPFAEEMLLKFGEFLPFAGAINHAGEVVSVGDQAGAGSASPGDLVDSLKQTLKTGNENYKAGAVFYDVRTTDNETGEQAEAIAVFIEHRDGKSAYEFFYPYKVSQQNINIDESFGNEAHREIFLV